MGVNELLSQVFDILRAVGVVIAIWLLRYLLRCLVKTVFTRLLERAGFLGDLCESFSLSRNSLYSHLKFSLQIGSSYDLRPR